MALTFSSGPVFKFEEIGSDLPRPPFAAMRFLLSRGMRLRQGAWTDLPLDLRKAMVEEGARDLLRPTVGEALTKNIPVRAIELTPQDLDMDESPELGVIESLGIHADVLRVGWANLPHLCRFVLNRLAPNKRLLWHAWSEITGSGPPPRTWRGLLAHAEVRVLATGDTGRNILRLLASGQLVDGKGLVLASASGRRAARVTPEIFDLHSGAGVGVVELDWTVQLAGAAVLWQAHVSTQAGEFFPIASLYAASSAAVCVADMLKEFDPQVTVREAKLVEEEWQVGRYDQEDATMMFDAR